MIFGILIAFLFIVAGLRATFFSLTLIFQWKQSQEWPSVRGKIIQSNLQSMLAPRGNRRIPPRLVTVYTPDILYAYRVNAESFQSKQIFIRQRFPSSFGISDDLVEKYPTGKDVTVFYDPNKPEFAVLERNRLRELLGDLVGGPFLILAGLAILVQVLQR